MVSAVVLSYNRCAEVLQTVEKLKEYQLNVPFEIQIIVVDNASTDNSAEAVSSTHPEILLIKRDNNTGVAGWNDGFKFAKNKYLLVLDDDSHVEEGLAEAVTYMENHENTGILAFNIVDKELQGDPHLKPEEAWQDGDDIAGFIGCGALIRKAVYEAIGGFAEWLFIYTHEFEYAVRCLDAGYQIKFFEKGLVIHRASILNRSNKRLRIFGTRNEMGIVYKFFSYDRSMYIWRILVNNLKFMKREGLKSGWYVFQGWVEFLKIKRELQQSPVSIPVQEFYAKNFWSTKPIFKNFKKKFIKL